MRIVVEGDSDVGAARRVVEHAGHGVTGVRVAGGKSKLDPKIGNYARAARHEPWVVFRDSDNQCPVTLRDRLLTGVQQQPLFALRIAHTMTEAWLMADRRGFADYFKLSADAVPTSPEELSHAKHTLLNLCLHSRSRDIREEVAHDGTQPGPLFVDHLNEFATLHWDIAVAAQNSPSLRRAVNALTTIPKEPPA